VVADPPGLLLPAQARAQRRPICASYGRTSSNLGEQSLSYAAPIWRDLRSDTAPARPDTLLLPIPLRTPHPTGSWTAVRMLGCASQTAVRMPGCTRLTAVRMPGCTRLTAVGDRPAPCLIRIIVWPIPRAPHGPALLHPCAPGIARHARPHARPQNGLRNSPPSPCEPWRQGPRLDEVRCANAASQASQKLPATPEVPWHPVHANAPVHIAVDMRLGGPHAKHTSWVVALKHLYRSSKDNDPPDMPSRNPSQSNSRAVLRNPQTANKL